MTTTPVYPNMLAQGITVVGTTAPFMLYAGDAPRFDNAGTVGAAAIAQFQLIALDAAGLIVPWVPTGSGGQTKLAGMAMQPGGVGATLAYAVGGCFNHEVPIWPSGMTTLALRRAATAGGPFTVGVVLGTQSPA